jgi:hypothetical protein
LRPRRRIGIRLASALSHRGLQIRGDAVLPNGHVAAVIWSIYFCRVLLGRIDERDYIIRA